MKNLMKETECINELIFAYNHVQKINHRQVNRVQWNLYIYIYIDIEIFH